MSWIIITQGKWVPPKFVSGFPPLRACKLCENFIFGLSKKQFHIELNISENELYHPQLPGSGRKEELSEEDEPREWPGFPMLCTERHKPWLMRNANGIMQLASRAKASSRSDSLVLPSEEISACLAGSRAACFLISILRVFTAALYYYLCFILHSWGH